MRELTKEEREFVLDAIESQYDSCVDAKRDGDDDCDAGIELGERLLKLFSEA